MKYLNSLKEYDMYGKEPSLYIGGQDYYGTFFGLITTIKSLISYFICSVYFI